MVLPANRPWSGKILLFPIRQALSTQALYAHRWLIHRFSEMFRFADFFRYDESEGWDTVEGIQVDGTVTMALVKIFKPKSRLLRGDVLPGCLFFHGMGWSLGWGLDTWKFRWQPKDRSEFGCWEDFGRIDLVRSNNLEILTKDIKDIKILLRQLANGSFFQFCLHWKRHSITERTEVHEGSSRTYLWLAVHELHPIAVITGRFGESSPNFGSSRKAIG